MSFESTYHNGFLQLGFKFIDWKNIGILKHPYSKSQVEILNEVYRILLSKNLLMKIEEIPDEEKNQIWEEVKPHVTHKPKDQKIKYAKAVYVLTEEKKEIKEPSKASKRHPTDIQPLDTGTGPG
jgi:hypothetical protein